MFVQNQVNKQAKGYNGKDIFSICKAADKELEC